MLEDSAARPRDSTPNPGPAARSRSARRPSGIVPCPPDDRADALEVLYHRVPTSSRSRIIVDLVEQDAAGTLDLSGLWVAYRRSRIVGAMLTQRLAGRALALWPPVVSRCWGAASIAPAMVREALLDAEARGIRLAQALLDLGQPKQAGLDLTRGGLPYVTDLLYLGRPTDAPLPVSPDLPRLAWQAFDPARYDGFARMLERSYEDSLDMPELRGLRPLEEMLQGHQARGPFDPERWRLGSLPGRPDPVAILLLSESEGRTWEVSYLGLAPEARGRGLGRAILAHALELARPHADRVELAVDVRNVPADRLYQRCGFRAFARRAVHLTPLGPPVDAGRDG